MTVQEYLNEKTTLFARAGIEDAENEAWLCFEVGSGMGRSEIRFSFAEEMEDVLTAQRRFDLEGIFARRADHEPLGYIVGRVPFYDQEFEVGPGVLIPRFDTEILVEAALGCLGFPQMLPGQPKLPLVSPWTDGACQNCDGEGYSDVEIYPCNSVTNADISVLAARDGAGVSVLAARTGEPVRILDLCTGSGCGGITIAHALWVNGIPYELVMTELSEKAASYARKNAERILGGVSGNGAEPGGDRMPGYGIDYGASGDFGDGCSWRVEIADLWPVVSLEGAFRADLIVSNPPYVTKDEMEELAPEVREYEPEMALTDEGNGLSFYERILSGLPRFLKPGGVLAVEHGSEQGEVVRQLMQRAEAMGDVGREPIQQTEGRYFSSGKMGISGIVTIKDYGQMDRVTCGRFGGSI